MSPARAAQWMSRTAIDNPIGSSRLWRLVHKVWDVADTKDTSRRAGVLSGLVVEPSAASGPPPSPPGAHAWSEGRRSCWTAAIAASISALAVRLVSVRGSPSARPSLMHSVALSTRPYPAPRR